MEKLVLIDGNSLINRAFYAMPLLTTKNNVYTNAVYGFINMFLKMNQEVKPDYIAVAFDVHAKTFRHIMYPEYKGTRKPSPPELHPQIELLKDVLRIMGVKVIEQAGIEADDIIGTLSKLENVKTFIYTGDRDSFQLINKNVSVCFTRRGITDIEEYNITNTKEKYGVEPNQVVDLKALMGDSSDNIIGIPGVGEKTAINLISTYGSLDNLYANINELTGKLKEKIELGKESAYFSQKLATIKTDCDIDKDLSTMRFKLPMPVVVREKFRELEFKSLINKDELFMGEVKESIITKKIEVQDLSDFVIKSQINAITIGDCVDIFDGETEFSFKIRQNFIDDGYGLSDVIKVILPIFNNKVIVFDKKKFNYILQDFLPSLLNDLTEDVAILKYLVDFSNAQTFEDVLSETGKDTNFPARSLFELYQDYSKEIEQQDMQELYRDIELPLSNVLFSMEKAGFKVDSNALFATGNKYLELISQLEAKIRDLTAEPTLNVNSPKQLGDALFVKLKIGKGKKTKTGYSTNADVLEELEDAHPVVPYIIKFRKIQKLYSTYIEGLRPMIDKSTGLIHTSFNQTVTATGRLSSKEPNLQNIPVRDDEGKELRKFFVAKSKDRVLVGADYSQIELRLLASFSNCKPLVDAFNSNVDVHKETASKVFNVPIQMVTDQQRRDAKAVNFGVIYGISEFGLAKNIGISVKGARDYIQNYFALYPEVKKYMDENVKFAKENGYAKTLLKRRRYIRELSLDNFALRSFGERVAMNMPLQGSAADIIKIAMINVFNRLKKEGLKSELVLQIHDELIIDAFVSEKEEVRKILKEEMEGAVKLSVPLTVEIGEGATWFDAK